MLLALTGGIATGKSTFAAALLRHLPMEFFDTDACARELLERDEEVRGEVRAAFGNAIFQKDGTADRARLREIVFAEDLHRRRLEAILHPVIRARWTERAMAARSGGLWLCVDIPLLYETGGEAQFDRVIATACSPATQRRRLRDRGLSDAIADRILAAQLDPHIKTQRADHLVWTDTTLASLEAQAALLARWLRHHFFYGRTDR